MDPVFHWTTPPAAAGGVVERSFQVGRPSGSVPGVLWLPAAARPACPLVLLGHGGSGHKRSDRLVDRARWFCSQAGVAAVAIDGPYHGDRVPAPLDAPVYQARIVAEGLDLVLDRMTGDWTATLEAVGAAADVDTARLGYVGVSMGTRFGLPLGAALGDQLRCAVFGKFGLHAPGLYEGAEVTSRIRGDAAKVTAPVLFHVQWDDEVFARDGQFALFDVFPSPDKQLVAYPGAHAEYQPGATMAWCRFVCSHLLDTPIF